MTSSSPIDPQQLTVLYQQLIDRNKTLILSTGSAQTGAEASYAPYVRDQLIFYILVSDLASHTANMLDRKQASVLFIEPEDDATNLFARQRVSFNCRVQEVAKKDVLYTQQLDRMQETFGETVSLLRSLNDFHLLQLTPVSGVLVLGFGSAFAIDPEQQKISSLSR
jgi:heme oxygenase (biliverdin-IX-beta and delta-forming)